MADELEFVCEKCVHYEVCDRSSRMIWARLSKEKVCTDFMEVVHCMACKYGELESDCHLFLCRHHGSDWNEGDHFCYYGERKDNDNQQKT